MQARFLLGPAGSGKTFRCLAEIRAELATSPEGPPLVLLAPKQATFQLERQLLGDDSLQGYTRLHILSFERLAGFVFDQLRRPRPQLLSDEGRVMVLRAVLGQRQNDLRVFRASARLPGLAQQLNILLRELQRNHLTAARLEELAIQSTGNSRLADKLHDLALLLRAYQDWLKEHQIQDADSLLDLATAALRSRISDPQSQMHLGALWLDGFAEMTPQELDLLVALAQCSDRTTLAFCLEGELREDPNWLSTWAIVGQTYRRCRERLDGMPDGQVKVEILPHRGDKTRFAANPVLQHLEEHWTWPEPFAICDLRVASATATAGTSPPSSIQHPASSLALRLCSNPEAEAAMAAHEILRYVREEDGRFRDCAVILRGWESHHDVLRRVFRRYGIPFFIDRRESVTHHPLAELTRYALRTVAYGWMIEDWFGALKTGLVPAEDHEIDELENAALAHGWKGAAWLRPIELPNEPESRQRSLESGRARVVPPFQQLADRLAGLEYRPTGRQLAEAIQSLWSELNVEQQIEEWSCAEEDMGGGSAKNSPHSRSAALHSTVWDQIRSWLSNVELAFADEAMLLRDWLPVLEAGLAGLTAGAVPPALDQVLVGTIDRSRNPDLQLAIVLGLNESVFPVPPPSPGLLTESDREALAKQGALLGPSRRARIGHERYFGYIAFTRPRQRLVVSSSRLGAEDRPLNPSPFIDHLKRLFPGLTSEPWAPPDDWLDATHPCELAPAILCAQRSADLGSVGRDVSIAPTSGSLGIARPTCRYSNAVSSALANLPVLSALREQLSFLAAYAPVAHLTPALARRLYGERLRTSVSSLEKFAACPFQFFVHAGLRAEERKVFEVDQRERGSFQHEVLARFHAEVQASNRQWRDLSPQAARELLGRIAAAVAQDYGMGLFQADPQTRFAARGLTTALQDFIEVAVAWMATNRFDPTVVEIGFGFHDSKLPAWEIDLGHGYTMAFRGKVDRVDIAKDPASGATFCAVLDYKSSQRKIDPLLLDHGIQIQLPAYLAALCQMPDLQKTLGVTKLAPAGIFYVNLRGSYSGGASRSEVLSDPLTVRREAYMHHGRFSFEALPLFDGQSPAGRSGQFHYALTKDGKPHKTYKDLMLQAEFDGLLVRVRELLVELGRRIYSGDASVDPYRKASESACDRCLCQSICRIDPWTHEYRVLKKRASAQDALRGREAPSCR